MEPFGCVLMKNGSILDLNSFLKEMQGSMEKWALDASPLLTGELCFHQITLNSSDEVYNVLFAPADDEIDAFTTMAFERLCGQLLIVLECQAKSQLPGGKYWDVSDEFKANVEHLKKANIDSERGMVMIDFLLKTKPNLKPMSLETYMMWLQNKSSKWLATLSEAENESTLKAARAAAPDIKKVF